MRLHREVMTPDERRGPFHKLCSVTGWIAFGSGIGAVASQVWRWVMEMP